MHGEVQEYVGRIAGAFPEHRVGRILEFGSADVNGTPRHHFAGCAEYVGVDWHPGPCIDVVRLSHTYRKPRRHPGFDVFVATEVFEHDPFWLRSMVAGWAALRDGGLWIFTIASSSRAPHDVEVTPGKTYYKGIDPEHVRWAAAEAAPCWGLRVQVLEAVRVRGGEDMYCHGFVLGRDGWAGK